jgi:outer membrane protein assembly factor BamB
VYSHGGTYSIVIKDNHYDAGSYCGNPTFCPVAPQGPYFITQLMADLSLEWQFKNTETQSCERTGSGGLTCKTTHPNGFEWCINAPAIDGNGVVYANSEDGNLYAINQGGTVKQRIFLKLAIGAAYTPLSIGSDGKIYTENDGHLFVVGT